MSDLGYLSVAEAGKRFRDGALSPVGLTQAVLARIDAREDAVRAWVTVTHERALDQARTATAELRAGRDRGPLHGIPVAVKDLVETAGIPTTASSRHLEGVVPERDATIVRRLKDAGAVILGKTNTHEFAYGGISPPTRNPWNLERIPGGSSGGSGAALVAGMCLLAIGTDTAGSIRIPSAANGVTGLKPTYGRVPKDGVHPLSWTLDHVGPMARSAADAAAMLSVLAGHDPADPTSSGAAVDDYLAGIDADLRGLRIGVPRASFFEAAQPGVLTAVEEAIRVLRSLGAEVKDITLGTAALASVAGFMVVLAEASDYHRQRLRTKPELFQPDVRAFLEAGELVPATAYVRSLRFQRHLREEFLAAMTDVDLPVTPTLPCTAPPIGATTVDLGGAAVDVTLALIRNTFPFNLAGFPAGSQPCGFDRDGLPVGLQIAGRPFEEATVLRAQHAFQRATDWHLRRPAA